MKNIYENYPCEDCSHEKTGVCYKSHRWSRCGRYKEWLKKVWKSVCEKLREKEGE